MTLILTPKAAPWLLERFCFVTLQHNEMGLEKNRKDMSCVICMWPLKRKDIPYFINSRRMLSIFHLTQTRPSPALALQIYIILCCSIGTCRLFDSSRKIPKHFQNGSIKYVLLLI